MPLTIALLGATGNVGGAILEACLARDIAVRALVRGEGRLTPRDGLVVREGSVVDSGDLDAVLADVDAVASALGTPPWSLSTITAAAMEALLPAMRRQRVRRLVAISALGIGDSAAQLNPIARLAIALPVPYVRDKLAMERAVRESDTDWTLVRPWVMRRGPAAGYEAADVLSGPPRALTFADTGAFVAEELVTGAYIGKAVSLAGRPRSGARTRSSREGR